MVLEPPCGGKYAESKGFELFGESANREPGSFGFGARQGLGLGCGLLHPLAAPCQMHVFRVFMVLTTCSRSFQCCLLPNRGWGGGGRGGGMMICIVGFINCSLSGFRGRCRQIRASVACSADAMDTTCKKRTNCKKTSSKPYTCEPSKTLAGVTLVTTRVCACFQIKKK